MAAFTKVIKVYSIRGVRYDPFSSFYSRNWAVDYAWGRGFSGIGSPLPLAG
jgi:hypothetical protein